jgi:hypothetical protein
MIMGNAKDHTLCPYSRTDFPPPGTRNDDHALYGDAMVGPVGKPAADIRRIYGPEKEALGVLAIEIKLLDLPTGH